MAHEPDEERFYSKRVLGTLEITVSDHTILTILLENAGCDMSIGRDRQLVAYLRQRLENMKES